MHNKKYKPDQIVKTCSKLESGLRFGPEGLRACQLGPFAAPVYWSEKELSKTKINKEMIVEKRQELFDMLNDDTSDVICKKCEMVETKSFKDVRFDQIGVIDHAPRTVCNLRCDFCGFTVAENEGRKEDGFVESQFDSLEIMKAFSPNDVKWDSWVDFNGGETSLLKNINEYLDFFKKMKMRVLLFTNAVKFDQSIYDGLENGSIQWVITSIDAGIPSTYKKTKIGNQYEKVMENSARYAYAGSKGGGNFAVKYIFTENNCSDDDIVGFAYSMLAIRPQKIWLTFDFTPFGEIPPDADNFGRFDFTKIIKAYVKLYNLLKKHGISAVHYTEGHLAKISKPGKLLLEKVLEEIKKSERLNLMKIKGRDFNESVFLKDFRNDDESINLNDLPVLDLKNETITEKNIQKQFQIDGNSKIVIAPASPKSSTLLNKEFFKNKNIVGFVDKNSILHGKQISNKTVHDYDAINKINPDLIFIFPPEQHKFAITKSVLENSNENTKIVFVSD
tara:strand:+ start:18412 stop:19923 length:1512 start_codon:yes stop_codon:yes gene_type:complete